MLLPASFYIFVYFFVVPTFSRFSFSFPSVGSYTKGVDQVLQTNIFFYITSVAVVIVSALLIIALYYIINILQNIRDVTDRVRRGSEQFAEDVNELRDNIKEEGANLRHLVTFVGRRTGWFPDAGKKKSRRTARKKTEE